MKINSRLALQLIAVVILFAVYTTLVCLFPKDFLQAYAALVISTLVSVASMILREMKDSSPPPPPPPVDPQPTKEPTP